MPPALPPPHREASKAVPTGRVVYLVRHGQSVWNHAQRSRNLHALVSQVDHPLTDAGCRQARALSDELLAALARAAAGDASAPAGGRRTLAALAEVEAVWTSPLCRAVQTALLGLAPVLSQDGVKHAPPLVLKPLLREKKNFGGLDTIGARRGLACVGRALGAFGQAASASELSAMRGVALEAGEAERKWWTSTVESRRAVRLRIRQLLAELEASDARSIALV
jgi:broad specificity phosphatase PhoE